jgi:hypothetical protein
MQARARHGAAKRAEFEEVLKRPTAAQPACSPPQRRGKGPAKCRIAARVLSSIPMSPPYLARIPDAPLTADA